MNEDEEKKKVSFMLFYDWEPLFEMLSREDRGDLISALFAYEKREELPEPSELSPQVLGLFDYLSKILDENKKRWQTKSNAGTIGGKKSGESRRSKAEANAKQNEAERSKREADSKQNEANAKQNEPKDKDKDKDKDKESPNGDKEREYKRDSGKPNPSTPKPKPDRNKIPPDIEKVREYCRQRNSSVDPDRFFNYFESQGWVKTNGQKVKDWQATIRTWEESNETKGNPTTPQPQDSTTDWNKIAKEVEQLGYFDNVNNYANVRAGIPATVREDVGG